MMKFDCNDLEDMPFNKGDLRENLSDWVRKIQALARILSALSWHEAKDGGAADFSDLEAYGWIIEDYAKAIGLTIDDNCLTLFYTDHALKDSVRRFGEVLETVKNSEHAPDIGIINRNLYDLEKLAETMADAFKLIADFKDLKRQIQTKTSAAPNDRVA